MERSVAVSDSEEKAGDLRNLCNPRRNLQLPDYFHFTLKITHPLANFDPGLTNTLLGGQGYLFTRQRVVHLNP